jgi:hypothetical protein
MATFFLNPSKSIRGEMPNAVELFLRHKTAAADGRKERDLMLWKQWKSGGKRPEDLDPLLKAYAPVFNQKLLHWKAPSLPKAAFRAELATQFIKALDKYDPNRGAALNTHVEINLRKAMRFNNRFQNLAYIPEGQASQIGAIQKAHDELSEDFGRPPSFAEIGKHIGMPPKRVETIQKARMRDIRASDFEQDPTERSTSYEDQSLAVAKNILPQLFPDRPDFHLLFHYTFGTGGYPQVSSTTELAKRMKKTQPQISRMKTQMGNTLRQRMGLGGGK